MLQTDNDSLDSAASRVGTSKQLWRLLTAAGLAVNLESGAMSHVMMRTGMRLHVDLDCG
jgi:hypothetical protein